MSASETPRHTHISALSVAAALTAVAIISVALRIAHVEEPASGRTQLLTLVAGAGAFICALPLAVLGAWLSAGWNRWLRSLLAASWMAVGCVPATMLVFAIENRIIEGHIEADSITDLDAHELFWTLFGAMGLFTPTGLKYLLPWPLLAIVTATALCFFFWPKTAMRTD